MTLPINLFILAAPLLALFPFLIPNIEDSLLAPIILLIAVIFADNGHIVITGLRIFSRHRHFLEKLKFILIIFFL